MEMRVNVCLLAFVLGCNVTAEIKSEVFEKNPVTLRCPHPVVGEVTWSRLSHGNKVNILTVDGDRDIKHISDRAKRYSSQADKSLHIIRVTVSDSGTYYCNNEPAVELKVISPVSHTGVKTIPPTTSATTTTQTSTTTAATTITTSATTTSATTTTVASLKTSCTTVKTQSHPEIHPQATDPHWWQMCVHVAIVFLCLLIMTSITVTTWRTARQKTKQRTAETEDDH